MHKNTKNRRRRRERVKFEKRSGKDQEQRRGNVEDRQAKREISKQMTVMISISPHFSTECRRNMSHELKSSPRQHLLHCKATTMHTQSLLTGPSYSTCAHRIHLTPPPLFDRNRLQGGTVKSASFLHKTIFSGKCDDPITLTTVIIHGLRLLPRSAVSRNE